MIILTDHEYHVVELNYSGMPLEIHQWLEEQFGIGDGSRWFYKHPKIYFVNGSDHLMFLLKVA